MKNVILTKKPYITVPAVLLILLLALSFNTTLAAAQPTDTGGHWASNEISSATSEGWAYIENGKFNPNKAATREEVIWMLIGAIKTIELEGFNINKEDCLCDFLDQPSSWAKGRMGIAVGNDIIQGYPDGTLKPKSSITRAEFAVIISRLINEDTPSVFSPFWDYIPQWALPGIKKTYSKEIIKGYPDKSFGARRNVTKAEALIMIKRWKSDKKPEISEYRSTYEKAEPFEGTPINLEEYKVHPSIGRLPFRAEAWIMEIEAADLKPNGIRIGSKEDESKVILDISVKPEDNAIYIKQASNDIVSARVVLAEGKDVSRFRFNAPRDKEESYVFTSRYDINYQPELDYSDLLEADITKISHIMVVYGDSILAIKNPLYKGGN